MSATPDLKKRVHDFWNDESCGEAYALDGETRLDLARQAEARYALEPYLEGFARFADGRDRDVLEIGVGMGADHERWAASHPRSLTGVDLTERAIEFTEARLKAAGHTSILRTADAENLPFPDQSFDLVYSWGVLHHSPDTQRCFAEVRRVLRPAGQARIMVYQRNSIIGLMLWIRYGLLAGRPMRDLDDIYFHHLESPGTKCFTVAAANGMLRQAGFSEVTVRPQLSHGDLLLGAVGQRHQGPLLTIAKTLWPRFLLRRLAGRFGLYLLIEARR